MMVGRPQQAGSKSRGCQIKLLASLSAIIARHDETAAGFYRIQDLLGARGASHTRVGTEAAFSRVAVRNGVPRHFWIHCLQRLRGPLEVCMRHALAKMGCTVPWSHALPEPKICGRSWS